MNRLFVVVVVFASLATMGIMSGCAGRKDQPSAPAVKDELREIAMGGEVEFVEGVQHAHQGALVGQFAFQHGGGLATKLPAGRDGQAPKAVGPTRVEGSLDPDPVSSPRSAGWFGLSHDRHL